MPLQVAAFGEENGYTKAFDYDGSNNMIYLGVTLPGTPKASAGWRIAKFTYDGSNNLTDIQYAGGSHKFAYVWNDRVTYSYS